MATDNNLIWIVVGRQLKIEYLRHGVDEHLQARPEFATSVAKLKANTRCQVTTGAVTCR